MLAKEESMEPEKKRMKFSMECVLDDSLTKEISTVEVHIGKIDKKNMSKVIQKLNSVHPVPSLQHLKRVRNGSEIILCLCEVDVEAFLKNVGFDVSFIEKYDRAEVASEAPKTRKQFEKANKLWPCNFHEDKYLEKLVNNDYEEIDVHEKWMKVALDCRGTVIVDPDRDVLVSESGDSIAEHPLKHSTMVAIDKVARSHGGGAWGPPTGKSSSKDYLCTNYHAYLFKEPCFMCAMALVHSRIKKVFYSLPNKNGALGSSFKLHSIKALNHHFEVYKNLLFNDALHLE